MAPPIRIEHDPANGVCELVLDRPEHGNAIDLELADALVRAATRTQHDDVHVVLLRADGRNFCVGGDIRTFDVTDPQATIRPLANRLHKAIQLLVDTPVPVVAAVQGWATGAGLSLALAADILILAEDARCKAAYGSLGLTPDGGLTWSLPRRLPRAIVADLLLSDRVLSAPEALDRGLASRVHPSVDLDTEARAYAQALAGRSRTAAVRIKALLQAADGADLSTQLDHESDNIAAAAAEPDGREGVTAFLEGRTPNFRAAQFPTDPS